MSLRDGKERVNRKSSCVVRKKQATSYNEGDVIAYVRPTSRHSRRDRKSLAVNSIQPAAADQCMTAHLTIAPASSDVFTDRIQTVLYKRVLLCSLPIHNGLCPIQQAYTPPTQTPTRLNCRVGVASAVWTEFATSSRRLPTDSAYNFESDQTDSIAVWLREL